MTKNVSSLVTCGSIVINLYDLWNCQEIEFPSELTELMWVACGAQDRRRRYIMSELQEMYERRRNHL